jgi:hypothetical protein
VRVPVTPAAQDVGFGSKMRRTRIEHISAGLPPITDIARRGWHGRKCHEPTLGSLLDHLVGARDQRCRHLEAERVRCLEVYRQFVPGRRLQRQVRLPLALEDAVGIGRRAPKIIEPVASVCVERSFKPRINFGSATGCSLASLQRLPYPSSGDPGKRSDLPFPLE